MVEIHIADAGELDALDTLYPRSFPDEDLMPLVTDMKGATDVVNLVAAEEGAVIGHVALSICTIGGQSSKAGLLGPLAVDPDHQRGGVGTALIARVLSDARAQGLARVMVLGDPGYYGRHGFTEDAQVQAPYTLPDEWAPAWQSVVLDAAADCAGVLMVPAPWRDPRYWA